MPAAPRRRKEGEPTLIERVHQIKDDEQRNRLLALGEEKLERHHQAVLESRDVLLQQCHYSERMAEFNDMNRRRMRSDYINLCKEFDDYGRCKPEHKKWAFFPRTLKLIKATPRITQKVLERVNECRDKCQNIKEVRKAKRLVKKDFAARHAKLINKIFVPLEEFHSAMEDHRKCLAASELKINKKMKDHWPSTVELYDSYEWLNHPTCSDEKVLAELTKRANDAQHVFRGYTGEMTYFERKALRDVYKKLNPLRDANQEELEDKTCSICLEEMVEDKKKYKRLPKCTVCRRRYHSHCIVDWIQKKTECPMCKTQCYCILNVDFFKAFFSLSVASPYEPERPEQVEHWDTVYGGAPVPEPEEFDEYDPE